MADLTGGLPAELPDGSVIMPGAIAPDQPAVRVYFGDVTAAHRPVIGEAEVGWTELGLTADITFNESDEAAKVWRSFSRPVIAPMSLEFTMTPKASRRLARLLYGLNRRQWLVWRARRVLARLLRRGA